MSKYDILVNDKTSLLPTKCYYSKKLMKPLSLVIRGAVIHFISAINILPKDPFNLDACIQILAEYGFSYHFLIERSGVLHQLVPLTYQAFHAGESSLNGITQWNSHSVGICLLGGHPKHFKGADALYPVEQYYTAGAVLRHLKSNYATFEESRITGHENIAGYRGKDDPGPNFKWPLLREVSSGIHGPYKLVGRVA